MKSHQEPSPTPVSFAHQCIRFRACDKILGLKSYLKRKHLTSRRLETFNLKWSIFITVSTPFSRQQPNFIVQILHYDLFFYFPLVPALVQRTPTDVNPLLSSFSPGVKKKDRNNSLRNVRVYSGRKIWLYKKLSFDQNRIGLLQSVTTAISLFRCDN